jgi:hypothetical protein
MRKTVLASLLALSWALAAPALGQDTDEELAEPEPQAGDDLEERLRALRREGQALRSEVGVSYRRLAAIEMSMSERVEGARVTITHRNDAGPMYRLVEVSYTLDGEQVFHHRDESGALGRSRSVEVHDGVLRPGEHTLSIVLRYVGDGGEVLRYLEGYRFTVRSSQAFVAPPGQHTRVQIRVLERGYDAPYQHRLELGFDRVVEPWR